MDGMLTPLNKVKDRIALLERMPINCVAVEVGAQLGIYSKYIEKIMQPKMLYLVDRWDPDEAVDILIDNIPEPIYGHESKKRIEQKFYNGISSGRVKIIQANSTAEAVESIQEQVDFIYLGGEPTYENTIANLEAAYKIVKNRGWICGHDYCEIFDSGVPRAVNKFITKYGLRLNLLTEEDKMRVYNRFGVNANLPPTIAYDSYGIIKDGKESRSWV